MSPYTTSWKPTDEDIETLAAGGYVSLIVYPSHVDLHVREGHIQDTNPPESRSGGES